MRTRFVFSLLSISLLLGAADPVTLTPEETKQLADARAEVLKAPEMKAETSKYNKARKAYQIDRDKFPADRSKEVAIAFRKAEKDYETAIRKILLAKNPTLAALVAKADAAAAPRKPNEGETVADSDSTKNPAIRGVKDNPALPRVLLIGDSISIGYTIPVREKLKDVANVHRIPVNGGATEVGLANMKAWLRGEKWDVIHFNFGLHDAKFASETTQRASREEYAKNLQTLITQMKATGAKLVFATTTPVPKDGMLTPTRKFDSIPARNEVAKKVMQENGVAIDDLYTVMLPEMKKLGRDNDVHFSPEGYELLAKAVAESIKGQLPKK